MEERKFVCKYCCKRFPCGKSLGGHIRTHMTEERSINAALAAADDSDTTLLNLDGVRNKRDYLWSHQPPAAAGGTGNGNPNIYGLRENPKKTMRFVHSHAAAAAANLVLEQDEKFCKECGKGFPSLKALCGHMASHSDKDKRINKFEDTSEKDKSVMYTSSQSDSDPCAPTRRSKRMRFKSLTLPNHNHPSSSSLVSEVEQEQEEVARCLMLLSKDSTHTHRGRFASESNSDNNSVVIETKSSSLETKFAIRNGNNIVEKKAIKDIKLKSIGVGVSNNSDSRCFRYGSKIKIVDSNVSNYEFKRPKEEYKSGFEDCRSKYNVTVFKKSGMKDLDHDRKRANYDSLGHNLVGNGNGKIANGWKYESLVSERVNGSYDLTDESDENSSETDSFPDPRSHKSKAVNRKKSSKSKKKLKLKKSKEHECPICYKIFRSGQALGGHKRSHFVGGSEENTLVIKQAAAAAAPPPPVPCLIDLNLPAPVDE